MPGKTMAEKFIYMKENEDWFRRLLSYEPRGNDYMSCTLITEPCTPGTDVGVLYFETSGWLPMCGHDTIGVSVALIETGMVKVTEPVTVIRLDTAAGVITVEAKVERGAVQEVSFTNAPAFVLREDLTVETEDFGAFDHGRFLGRQSLRHPAGSIRRHSDLPRKQRKAGGSRPVHRQRRQRAG